MFNKFVNWLTLADYDAEKRITFRSIIGRHSSGNISLLFGRFLTSSDVRKIGQAGDLAAQHLRNLNKKSS